MAHSDRRKPCHVCDKEVAHTLDGRPYSHKCEVREADPAGFELAASRGVTHYPAPTPDEFVMAAPPPAAKLNVSGQPDARRDHMKRYIIVDPDLGDFRRTVKDKKPKGITRVTTFVKAASDSMALNQWQKRNVLIGAARRPDIVGKAHRLTHLAHRAELDRLVEELTTAAGAKVSADEGTFLHGFTEHMDAGDCTWQDAAPQYQPSLRLYAEELAAAGLEPVPGLIERTVFVREFGGVVGTFDRVFYHRPSGTYIVGDLKTGKSLGLGMNEIEAQVWFYAHGINQNGVYDWNTDTWDEVWQGLGVGNDRAPLDRVRTDVGVIVHMPVQGDDAGRVMLRKADLVAGRGYAELCHSVRSHPRSKVEPWDGGLPADPTWEERFAAVRNGPEASALWLKARDAGVDRMRLQELVAIARTALAGRG